MTEYIVGVDKSDRAAAALRWAVAHAGEGDRVVAVHAWQMPAMLGPELVPLEPSLFENDAKQALDQILDRPECKASAATVVGEVISGHPGQALVDRADEADLLVIGARGHGGVAGLLLGSTSTYAVHHSRVPVVVVPGER